MTTLPPDGDNTGLQQENQHSVSPQDEFGDGADSSWRSERYEPVSEIGVGAYGVVFKAKDRERGDGYVAMKCLRVENTEQGMPLSMVREIALLKQLETKEHSNVVRLLDICLGRKTLYETQLILVFEYIDQDLDMFLKNLPEAGLESHRIRDIMWQMFSGIDFLHTMRVIHRDLKPQNILITRNGTIKIADFGLARIYSYDMALTAVVVTLWYRAPEVLLQDSYATPVDIWSAGCIFAELFNRRPLFRGNGDVNQLKKIFDFIGRPAENEWPADVAIPIASFPPQLPRSPQHFVPRMDASASDLFMKLLFFDPNQRLTPKDAMTHSYFQTTSGAQSSANQSVSSSETNSFRQSDFRKRSEPNRQPPISRPSGSLCANQGLLKSTYFSDTTLGLNTSSGCDVADGVSEPRRSTKHSSITPDIEQVSTKDECGGGDEYHPPKSSKFESKRSFGDLLPVNAKDGASGHLLAQSLSSDLVEESAFLTPPSDLGSSSDSETPSSRSSTSSNPEEDAEESSSCFIQSKDASASSSIIPSSLSADVARVVKRTHKVTEDQSRMSWTHETVESFCENSGATSEPTRGFNVIDPIRPGPNFTTPTYQILESGKFVPYLKGSTFPPHFISQEEKDDSDILSNHSDQLSDVNRE